MSQNDSDLEKCIKLLDGEFDENPIIQKVINDLRTYKLNVQNLVNSFQKKDANSEKIIKIFQEQSALYKKHIDHLDIVIHVKNYVIALSQCEKTTQYLNVMDSARHSQIPEVCRANEIFDKEMNAGSISKGMDALNQYVSDMRHDYKATLCAADSKMNPSDKDPETES